jgi:integrase
VEARGGVWYGRWRTGRLQFRRKLGPVREPGGREGLTRTQAEAALRRVINETRPAAPEERVGFDFVAEQYMHHLEHVKLRKASTLRDYRVILDKHLIPYFGTKPIDRITPAEVSAYMSAKLRAGLAVKTVTNTLNFAHGIFAFAVKRGWAVSNVVAMTDRPRAAATDPDIRYLDSAELEALLRAAAGRDDVLGPTDQAVYVTAAMTGLRQGELAGLRWRDVDWSTGVIRVRRSYTRGEWGTPKSRRSSRAVPMADRVGAELERHFARSVYQGDDQLVFCHPQTGGPYDASKMRKRFYEAMELAGMKSRCGREEGVTFHSLRHTFGTRMAAVGVPIRTLQEWMGHRDYSTTLVYADFAPDPAGGAAFAEKAFGWQAAEQSDPRPPAVTG